MQSPCYIPVRKCASFRTWLYFWPAGRETAAWAECERTRAAAWARAYNSQEGAR